MAKLYGAHPQAAAAAEAAAAPEPPGAQAAAHPAAERGGGTDASDSPRPVVSDRHGAGSGGDNGVGGGKSSSNNVCGGQSSPGFIPGSALVGAAAGQGPTVAFNLLRAGGSYVGFR